LDLFRSADRARHVAGWRRALDTFLRKIGPTWPATPIRRAVQTGSLVLYLWLFFVVSWPYAARFSSRVLPDKEWLPAEAFLWVDPLVGLSTAIAARAWNVALVGMGVILAASWVLPRGFCGYLCPLGTLIDLVDFIVDKGAGLANKLRGCALLPLTRPPGTLSPAPSGGEGRGEGDCLVKPHRSRREVRSAHGWTNVRFYVLAAVLAAAVGGVLFSGFVAAIPVLTRGLLFSFGNLQLGLAKNWGMVPPYSATVWLSLALFLGVFLLGLFGPRFWCRYLCPSGALLSLFGFVRRFKRQVDDRCIGCGKCLSACPFDAVAPDFSSRTLNCAFCQTCGGVCPTGAIHFVPLRTHTPVGKSEVTLARPLTRRAMLGAVAIGTASACAVRWTGTGQARPIRPPGSLAEDQFLDLCIRCGQCLKVCPGPVLQAAGLEHGLEALWTPVAIFPHAGCHQDCNFCTQVCPTGAIRPLTVVEKRHFRMGLAVVDLKACLPHRGELDCRFCYEECTAAGYRAIEMRPVRLATGPVPEGTFSPEEIEQMGQIQAPFVNADACVGCGLCEYRCQAVWVSQQQRLQRSAIMVRAS